MNTMMIIKEVIGISLIETAVIMIVVDKIKKIRSRKNKGMKKYEEM